MPKPTIASLAVTVTELHREVVALRQELAILRKPSPHTQPKLAIAEAITWLNENAPAKSYTQAQIAYATTQLASH